MFKTLKSATLTLISLFTISIVVIVTQFNTATVSAQTSTESSSKEVKESPKGRVNLKSTLSVSEVVSLAQEKGLRLEMIEGDFTVGSLSLYDFYFVKPDIDPKSIEEDYKQSRLAYFKDLLKQEPELSQEQKNELASQFGELKAALERNDAGEIKVKKLTLSGDEKAIQDLSQNTAVDQVNVIKEKPQPTTPSIAPILQKLQNKTERVNKKQSASYLENQFSTLFNSLKPVAKAAQVLPSAPRYGQSQTQASSVANRRETTQWLNWQNVSFGSTQTYEHELFYDNYDGNSYLNGSSTPPGGCFPVVDYVATSFPSTSRPFVDTRVKYNGLCETQELEYTLGAFQANKLQANTWYNTYFRTTNGNASNDRFYVSGQVGHQYPTSCAAGQETWCSYGDNPSVGDRHVDLLQAWNTQVPGTVDWGWSVRFCEHNRAGGFGRCLDLRPGTHDLTDYNFNDILTTIRIGMGMQWKVTVYDNVNTSTNQCYGNGWQFISNGERWEINLYENNLNFNDKVSCAIIELN